MNDNRRASTSQYSVEEKAKALVRIRLGEPAKRVALELGYPPRTVQTWAAEMRQSALEESDRIIIDQDYHLVIRTGELLQDAVEDLADSGEPLYKYLVPLNIVRGTPEDKILKRQDQRLPVPPGKITINFISQHRPPEDVIEGELVEGEDS